MDTTQKSDLRPDVEQNGDEMVCRDCKFYRYAYCDLLQIPTAATFEVVQRLRPEARMRLTELWEGRCLCGAEVSTPAPAFVCRKCGSHGRFERPECRLRWEPTEDTTLSEREGVK